MAGRHEGCRPVPRHDPCGRALFLKKLLVRVVSLPILRQLSRPRQKPSGMPDCQPKEETIVAPFLLTLLAVLIAGDKLFLHAVSFQGGL